MLTKNDIILIYAKRIRELMEEVLVECLQEVVYGFTSEDENNERFSILKELSLLTTELLNDKDIEQKILDLANDSSVNGEDNETKLKIFKVLRNIIAHLPFFESYDDIVLSRNILTWNCPGNSSILRFFDNNDGKEIISKIYYKFNDEPYTEIKEIKIIIKKIDQDEIKLNSIISLNDAIWMFSIVDYYLDYLGLKIQPQFGLSI
jgi:hypothetical protein